MQRKTLQIALVKLLGMVLTGTTLMWSQDGAVRQVLTLEVVELNKIDLTVPRLVLTIENLTEESFQPSPVISTTTKLIWTSNGENRKITIASSNASPRFGLKAEAQNISEGAGASAGEVLLTSKYDSRSCRGCVPLIGQLLSEV